ncbi:rhomboid family intramembrane serine protease [Caldibacillus thermolactis]|jgi:rhomboid protease GluP|uniref:Rhomboid family intramembrane serine protease n=1 Tax=Pallidibacillus thermolactis TaxID=251051 RepID=A0ABT2WIW2_9BACI|nr:rhomboid family intramembrane serine protease [Pallidibacillus thermolactis]MCU9594931.1 rhomboid family intramembrane serine protease [Pallidibacillus thermolactis]MCU9602309.1 rhomboid family intramembrane serine protease [Pallidibacillus thermolactis subsp. kokeshiiformis]MED1672707.1 rhomboid family intramembrane serine protease [Pallidibacillus thermolactis subsp. kokeshiiformis]
MKVINEVIYLMKRFPVVSTILIINLVVYLITTISIFPNRTLFQLLAGVNILISQGEWWRLFTPIFVHGDFYHLFYNALIFIFAGYQLEQLIKKISFLFIYFSSGIFANIVTFILAPPIYVHVGASGAIFGLLGTFAGLIYLKKLPRYQTHLVSIILIFSIVFTFFTPNVNIYAHIGGLIWGILCGYLVAERKLR